MTLLNPQVTHAERFAAWTVLALGVLEIALLQYLVGFPQRLMGFAAASTARFWEALAAMSWGSWRPPELAGIIVLGFFNAHLVLWVHMLGRGLGRQWLLRREALWWTALIVASLTMVFVIRGILSVIHFREMTHARWSDWPLSPFWQATFGCLVFSALQVAMAAWILWLASRRRDH